MSRLAALALAVVGASAPARGARAAAASEGPIDRAFTLEWSAPSSCPAAAEVQAAIRGILRETPRERLEGRSVAARAQVRRGGGDRFALALTLEVDGATSERAIDAGSCAVLGEAAALLIAMTIDPLATPPATTTDAVAEEPAGPPFVAVDPGDDSRSAEVAGAEVDAEADEATSASAEPEGPQEAAAPAPAPAPAPGDRSDATPSPRSRRPTVDLGAAILGGSAGLASVGVGVGATIGLGRDRWRIEATGAFWAPRARSLAAVGLPQAHLDLLLGVAGLRGCGVLAIGRSGQRGRIELPLCAGLEVGGMRGEGRGLAGARRHVGPWAAITASPGVLVRVGDRVALALRIDAALAISRPAFEVRGLGVVFKADAGALAASLGVVVRLGRRPADAPAKPAESPPPRPSAGVSGDLDGGLGMREIARGEHPDPRGPPRISSGGDPG